MSRMERIRRSMVSRIMSSDEWWKDAKGNDDVWLTETPMRKARRMIRQAKARHRQIVERLLSGSETEETSFLDRSHTMAMPYHSDEWLELEKHTS
jgi:hypothetical protein